MRLLITVSILIFGTGIIYSQQAVSSASGEGMLGEINISWTLGESFVTTHEGDNIILTEGVNQPVVVVKTNVNLTTPYKNIKFYPNPAKDYMILDFNKMQKQKYTVSIIDLQGKLLLQQEVQKEERKVLLNVQQLSLGAYQIVVSNGSSNQVFTMVKE